MRRFVSLDPPKNLDDEYYTVFCQKVHVEKFAFGWGVFGTIVGVYGLFHSLFFGNADSSMTTPMFFVIAACSILLLIGAIKKKWWLYIPKTIEQVIYVAGMVGISVYVIVLGFIYSFCDDKTFEEGTTFTADKRIGVVLVYFAFGIGFLLLAGLFIYFTAAIIRACQFTRVDEKPKTVVNTVVELKKEQLV